MDEILGLVDALESIILDSKKIPMLEKVIVDEKKILNLIDKIRIVIRSEENIVRKTIEYQKKELDLDNKEHLTYEREIDLKAKVPITLVQEAEKEAIKIKEEANSYADYVLANLQLMVTKMQKNVITIEKGIEDGRETLNNLKVSE